GGRDPGPAAPSHDPGAATAVSQIESVFVGVPALAGASAEDRLKAVLQRRQTETRPTLSPAPAAGVYCRRPPGDRRCPPTQPPPPLRPRSIPTPPSHRPPAPPP